MAQCRKKKQEFQRVGKFQTRTGTLQPALWVRVGSRVEISNPHPPRRKPARQTRGYAQPVIIPMHGQPLQLNLGEFDQEELRGHEAINKNKGKPNALKWS
jgi:hypothetical protein